MSATMAEAFSALTTINFIEANGPVNPSGPIGRDISQPGVSGLARMRIGYVGKPFKISTIGAYANASAQAAGKILYAQYREHNVTYTDPRGIVWYNLFVLDVTITDDPRIISGTGLLSGATHLLFAEWELQSGALSY